MKKLQIRTFGATSQASGVWPKYGANVYVKSLLGAKTFALLKERARAMGVSISAQVRFDIEKANSHHSATIDAPLRSKDG